jgi:hypothetical protein
MSAPTGLSTSPGLRHFGREIPMDATSRGWETRWEEVGDARHI